MTPSSDETTGLPASDDLRFTDDEPEPDDSDVTAWEEENAEFRPRAYTRTPWLTRLLVWLAIFLTGFVVGVIAARALQG